MRQPLTVILATAPAPSLRMGRRPLLIRCRGVFSRPAIKKRSPAGVIHLITIHGFPTNMSVCEDLIAPYNKDPSLSVMGGEYFCEELR
jgi:hypothetical protein